MTVRIIENGIINRKLNNIYFGVPLIALTGTSVKHQNLRVNLSLGPSMGKTVRSFFLGQGVLKCRNGKKLCLATMLEGECIFLLVYW